MVSDPISDLHDSLIPILHHSLMTATLPHSGLALDLACGSGLKLPLLVRACGPDMHFIALDVDPAAVYSASSAIDNVSGVVGDALVLPLRDSCCTIVFCIAALGLFRDQRKALREMRRVICAGGRVFIATATQAWAIVTDWPDEVAEQLQQAYMAALEDGCSPLPASPDVGGELAQLLADTGFCQVYVRGFLLDISRHPLQAELPLLPWTTLRPILHDRLAAGLLSRCDSIAAMADVELCTLALVAQAGVG